MDNIVRYCTAKDFSFPEVDISSYIVSLAIRVHRQNARQGTVSVKDRTALVSRSNRKPWKQKGTGRARAGTARSPLWRGGAVSHGPQKRVRVLSINKKMSLGALQLVFSEKITNQKVVMVNWIPNRSCSEASSVLKKGNLLHKNITLLYQLTDFETYYAFSNIPGITLISYDAVNSYIVARNEYIVGLEKDSAIFQELVQSWLI